MTAKRLYVHIGMPKTGTSSIQRYFAENAEALLRFHDLCYLYGYRDDNGPYAALVHPDFTPSNCQWLFPLTQHGISFLREKNVEATRKNCTSLLISDEAALKGGTRDCTRAFVDDIPRLQEIFTDREIWIIMYLRRADDFCKSIYGEMSKHGFRNASLQRTFAIYCHSMALSWALFDLPWSIQTLAGAVGRENLILRLYDRKNMKNGSSVDDFADIFGIEVPLGIHEEKCHREENPSIPAEALPYLAPLTDATSPLDQGLRGNLINLVRASFGRSGNFQVKGMDTTKVDQAIDELDALAPGYKSLYEDREFSLDWPELRLNPPMVAMSEVLCHMADSIDRLQQQQQELLGGMRALLEGHDAQQKD